MHTVSEILHLRHRILLRHAPLQKTQRPSSLDMLTVSEILHLQHACHCSFPRTAAGPGTDVAGLAVWIRTACAIYFTSTTVDLHATRDLFDVKHDGPRKHARLLLWIRSPRQQYFTSNAPAVARLHAHVDETDIYELVQGQQGRLRIMKGWGGGCRSTSSVPRSGTQDMMTILMTGTEIDWCWWATSSGPATPY